MKYMKKPINTIVTCKKCGKKQWVRADSHCAYETKCSKHVIGVAIKDQGVKK